MDEREERVNQDIIEPLVATGRRDEGDNHVGGDGVPLADQMATEAPNSEAIKGSITSNEEVISAENPFGITEAKEAIPEASKKKLSDSVRKRKRAKGAVHASRSIFLVRYADGTIPDMEIVRTRSGRYYFFG